jgi:hypothetical protein
MECPSRSGTACEATRGDSGLEGVARKTFNRTAALGRFAVEASATKSRSWIKINSVPDQVAQTGATVQTSCQQWPPNWSVARFECSDNVLYHLEITAFTGGLFRMMRATPVETSQTPFFRPYASPPNCSRRAIGKRHDTARRPVQFRPVFV